MTYELVERNGRRFALVPEDEMERISDALDELEAIRAYDRFHATGPHEMVPATVVDRLIAGENAIRVWREHRRLSAQEIAATVGISKPYLSQLEHGARKASHAVLKKLAATLAVDVDDLI
jgi:DNA-binding XRE family transcriptional regulator